MKTRKNLSLSPQAVARGERLAHSRHTSLSELVEKQLLQIPDAPGDKEEFWPGPALKPLKRRNDPRGDYLRKKHA